MLMEPISNQENELKIIFSCEDNTDINAQIDRINDNDIDEILTYEEIISCLFRKGRMNKLMAANAAIGKNIISHTNNSVIIFKFRKYHGYNFLKISSATCSLPLGTITKKRENSLHSKMLSTGKILVGKPSPSKASFHISAVIKLFDILYFVHKVIT